MTGHTEKKPLHVRVAEALGCDVDDHDGPEHYYCRDGDHDDGDTRRIRRYDTDWGAAGPLIEKYDICLIALVRGWRVSTKQFPQYTVNGPTPMVAVCVLIVDLVNSGKLDG